MDLSKMASDAGFGGTQRNTLRVKLERFAKMVAAAEREACAQLAMDHECGGEDDFICQYQNCGLCIAGAIRMRSNVVIQGPPAGGPAGMEGSTP